MHLFVQALLAADTAASPPRVGTPHAFWGISTGSADQSLAPNRFTAPNFILSAPAAIQKQPGFTHPTPPRANLSRAMNRTMLVWHQQPVGKKVLTFNGGAPCGNHHPADNIWPIDGKTWNACKVSDARVSCPVTVQVRACPVHMTLCADLCFRVSRTNATLSTPPPPDTTPAFPQCTAHTCSILRRART